MQYMPHLPLMMTLYINKKREYRKEKSLKSNDILVYLVLYTHTKRKKKDKNKKFCLTMEP